MTFTPMPRPPKWRDGENYHDYCERVRREEWRAGDIIPMLPGEMPSDTMRRVGLPADSAPRKQIPIATGVVDYFPDAMVAIAELSRKGNDQHNPGQPLHWSRGKSDDHPDALMRHFIERGKTDVDGIRHSAKVAWRALAILQLELEAAAKERTWRLGDAVRARAWPGIPEEAVGLPCDVERHE